MLGDKRFLRTFKARNILSFGTESPEIELQSLNVPIGPNGSGKSNLIGAIAENAQNRPPQTNAYGASCGAMISSLASPSCPSEKIQTSIRK
jgi:recombinational DNA repair ATPase RecF